MDIQEKVIGIFGLIGVSHSIGTIIFLNHYIVDNWFVEGLLLFELILGLLFIGIFMHNTRGNK